MKRIRLGNAAFWGVLGWTLLAPMTGARGQRGAPQSAGARAAYAELTAAYAALRAKELDSAITHLVRTISFTPDRLDVRKELAYAYFRAGRNDLAKHQFEEVLSRDSLDATAALELAYLDYESLDPVVRAQTHALFRRVRASRDSSVRARATEAFGNVDRDLAARIHSLQDALTRQPGDGALLRQLATAAQERNDTALANSVYEKLAVFYGDHIRLQYAEYLLATAQRARAQQMLEGLLGASDPYLVEEARDHLAELRRARGTP